MKNLLLFFTKRTYLRNIGVWWAPCDEGVIITQVTFIYIIYFPEKDWAPSKQYLYFHYTKKGDWIPQLVILKKTTLVDGKRLIITSHQLDIGFEHLRILS